MIDSSTQIAPAVMPMSQNGTRLRIDDLGKKVSITIRNNQGDDEGSVKLFVGVLEAFAYEPARVHIHHVGPMPSLPDNVPDSMRGVLTNLLGTIAKANGFEPDSESVVHGEPEKIAVSFVGMAVFTINVTEVDWLIDVVE